MSLCTSTSLLRTFSLTHSICPYSAKSLGPFRHICMSFLPHFWKCNFPMTRPVRPLVARSFGRTVSRSVGLWQFPKRAGSYTSMLRSEHLFFLLFLIRRLLKCCFSSFKIYTLTYPHLPKTKICIHIY